MSLSTVLFLFLAHLGVGIMATLVAVSREAGVKFFRFNAGLAAILLAVALAFRPTAASDGTIANTALISLAVSELAILLYWGTVGRALASIRPMIVAVAVGAGTIALVAQALVVAADRALPTQAMTVVSFLSSAALLGGACTAMILGHWYLVIPSMQVSHLQSIVKVHIASMIVRIVVVGAAVVLAIATWQPGLGPSFRHYITSVAGIFFWQRVLFGLFGPALLSYLTWETAKIRSTQSATGILYVVVILCFLGELTGQLLRPAGLAL